MSQKQAETRVPIHEHLAQRWSPRAFEDKPVESKKLMALLEAARWAPSCFNEQPWVYFVATREEPDEYNRLFECLVEGNQTWAVQAPVLMLAVAKLHFDRNGKPNRHAQHDVGLANANLVTQATHLGLHVHQMAGFDVQQARKIFKIPEGYEPLTMIAIGYLGHAGTLPPELEAKENALRQRKALEDFVYHGTWNQKAPHLKS